MPAVDHSQMDHSGHMGHGGGDGMDDMCSMSMLFTWDTTNLCIVFKQWHIRSTPGLIVSLIAVVLIAMGYEGLRATCRMYEKSMEARVDSAPNASEEAVTETTPFLRSGQNRDQLSRRSHLIKSLLYGFQNFYAFMLM
ncbi:Ctr copper transporter family protein [Akanthomyces lecanii RCEF 1005]|uniref:Copper transport protein n=1 Tax=Akanthomyces lecanii RCEF 1005 TaxID=1081108 RepID=A0A168HSC3_CORDF|nr:Ctr copper transporter family protein [Akanthomyces lecanii RCEF 1005]